MLDWLNQYYLWIKALHVIAVIAWMSGMFYLPRLFVYHCETVPGSPESERFKVMERKLLRIITNPAMVAAWIFGLTLSVLPATDAWAQPWFHAKFALVLVMSGVHGLYARWVKQFARDANTHPQKFYRMWNEAPTLLMIAIVILVVVKPF
ncbi:MAG: protoporphyrinogen oxidase HemJ [Alphaproteobacteria bacterium]|nr:protoporphyrinogen oxidase HemJ [Alphaproteobacteria bacterium]MBU6471497.1 protoporphyrinogen oxidase HemJ [Alphaproteobacteria bacterium]MDE2012264.1 protoporphyrinogen oxidase HemJ [Alphaproteobacteria bacterium]MDE2072831.1 protoporphyrinogen oxidase HemJ [Alphaproteobacteria bacterium]MDE2351741.1 protoporphyrinogen oxidase HemJ [Alphaproteobacteria bacterium]